jgi:hypothetical protein
MAVGRVGARLAGSDPSPLQGGVAVSNGPIRKLFELGGLVAAVILIALGIGAIVVGAQERSTVHANLGQEQIVGSPDMTPAAIAGEARKAGLKDVSLPTCGVAGKVIASGTDARCFAQYMRVHALEATGGFTYAQMGQYEAKPGTPKGALAPGGGTNDTTFAVMDAKTGQPAANGARDVWVNETALSTALNASYMAERPALFGIVMGIALLLAGIGFAVLDIGALAGARTLRLRRLHRGDHGAPAPAA